MKLIVAVDAKWGIGYKNELLEKIPEDMKFFRKSTQGKVIIMGRETYYSLPNQSPLKNRIHIVLSRNEEFIDDRVIICRSIEEVLEKVKVYDKEDLFVVGGQAIYTQFLPYCNKAYITKIDKEHLADKYFPNLDENSDWELLEESEVKENEGIEFKFTTYVNKLKEI